MLSAMCSSPTSEQIQDGLMMFIKYIEMRMSLKRNGGGEGFHTPYITICYNYILSITLIKTPHFTPHGGYLPCILIGIKYVLGVWLSLGWNISCMSYSSHPRPHTWLVSIH